MGDQELHYYILSVDISMGRTSHWKLCHLLGGRINISIFGVRRREYKVTSIALLIYFQPE